MPAFLFFLDDDNCSLRDLQISDLLGRDTALCYTLWALRDAAQKTFLDILKSRGEKLLRYPPLVSVDLSPPKAVREGVSVLLEIIETHNGMMVPATGKNPDFDPVISALLDPIIQVFLSLMLVVEYHTLFMANMLLIA